MSAFAKGLGIGVASSLSQGIDDRNERNEEKRKVAHARYLEQVDKFNANKARVSRIKNSVDILETNFGVNREDAVTAAKALGTDDIQELRAFISSNTF